MKRTSPILIKNIFYMLSYAFERGDFHSAEREYGSEPFDNVKDLFGRMVDLGTRRLVRGGLFSSYDPFNENLPTIRGKLNINGTILDRIQRKRLVNVDYEEMTANNVYNRIIKTALAILSCDAEVDKGIRERLSLLLPYFEEVSPYKNLLLIPWNSLRFDVNTKRYQTLLFLCRFFFSQCLLNEDGEWKLREMFDEEHMCMLYESFLRSFFKKEHPEIYQGRTDIQWDVAEGETLDKLPKMETDLTLNRNGNFLIVDAKYYGSVVVSSHGGKEKFRSANIYQIEAYVNNFAAKFKDASISPKIGGLLLYAKPGEEDFDFSKNISGHPLTIKTLDLSRDFSEIRRTLDDVATTDGYL